MSEGAPQTLRKALWSIAAACAVSALTWIAGTFATLDAAYLDWQAASSQRLVASDIVILEIDARSLKELGEWPLPRSLHARVIDNLRKAGAERIFIDIDFSSPSLAHEDEQLRAAIDAAAGSIILPVFWQPSSHDGLGLLLSEPLPTLKAHAQLGLVNLVPGKDGLVREVADFSALSSDVRPVWTHFTERAEHAGALRLDYRIAPSSFERISYADVARARIDSLHGKTVFVGATALELGDIVAVPVHRALPGIVVQALAVESALKGALRSVPSELVLLALLPWIVLCAWLLHTVNWRQAPFVTMTLILLVLAACALAYDIGNLIIPVSPFIAATLVVVIGALIASLDGVSLRALRTYMRAREQDALLRLIAEKSSDAIVSIDAQAMVLSVNPAAVAVFGRARAELIDAHLAMLSPEVFKVLQAPAQAQEVLLVRGDGSRVVLEITRGELEWGKKPITTLTMRDVTERRTREEQLRYMAQHDVLTALPNRAFLSERLQAALAPTESSNAIALLMLDLDGFKEVNDTLGHSMGDELLREVSARLARFVTDDRIVARVGGDEFAVLWKTHRLEEIEEFTQQLLLVIEEPILIKGIPVSLGTSIGIARSPEHAKDAEALLQRADVALYAAKRNRSRVEFYDPSEDTHTPRRLEMLTLLRAAVSKGELHLHFQPKVTMRSGRAIEVEALCRWDSPELGRVSPGEFIALAEASDVIKPLTEWTIRQALLDCRSWHEQGIDLNVAVNLSARHLQDARLPQWLDALFHSTQTQPSWLELEITESAIMADPDRASKILRALSDMGVTLSIDDFGTGYSSLAYLRTLAVHRLKIDRSFVNGIETKHAERVIVESTIKLAHGLGLEAVAEGIETDAQFAILRELGCDLGQGYVIAKPMPKDALVSWWRARDAVAPAGARPFFLRQSTG